MEICYVALLLISLLVPFRITLYSKNDNFYTINSIKMRRKIEQEENYLELDYDTISKNYIICYDQVGQMN